MSRVPTQRRTRRPTRRGLSSAATAFGATAFTAIAFTAMAFLAAPAARADDIEILDLQTCEERRIAAYEITSETWAEVKYRERERGPEKSIPTLQVVDVRRESKSGAGERVRAALTDYRQGRFDEALGTLQDVAGGGYRVELGTGRREYRPFVTGNGDRQGRRPDWTLEYAHYWYAQVLFEKARRTQDKSVLEEVLLALEDVPLPASPPNGDTEDGEPAGPQTTGGFLARFKGGNSRFYPHAMLLHAETLLALGRADQAREVYAELGKAADEVPLGPRWHFEARTGPARILAAEGQAKEAQDEFRSASNTMLAKCESEASPCLKRTWGEYFNQARAETAALILRRADQEKSAVAELERFLQDGTPEALRQHYQGRLEPDALQAVIAGARAPRIRAITLNGLGLGALQGNRPEEALAAFQEVVVKYSHDPEDRAGAAEQAARALYFLAQAAESCTALATKRRLDEARAMYEALGRQAQSRLKSEYAESSWAKR